MGWWHNTLEPNVFGKIFGKPNSQSILNTASEHHLPKQRIYVYNLEQQRILKIGA